MQQRDAADGAATEMFDRHMVGLCPARPVWVFVACRKAVCRAIPMRSLSALRNRFPNRFIEQFFLWRRPWKMHCN